MGRSSNPIKSLKRSFRSAKKTVKGTVKNAGKVLDKAAEEAVNVVAQGATGGIYKYDDGKFSPDGVTTKAAKTAVEEASKIASKVFAKEDVPTLMDEEPEAAEDVIIKPDASGEVAEQEVNEDERLMEEALKDRRSRSEVGSSRVANLLGGMAEDDEEEDKISVASLLA